jgi:thioredoxin-like negative regulator of GroEL
MDAGGAAQLLAQCKALNEQRLFPSAAQLASFLVNANQHDPDAFATLGTALLGAGEHKRALGAFQAALDLLGVAPDAPDAVELRCRIAECYAKVALRQHLALSISHQKRTITGCLGLR